MRTYIFCVTILGCLLVTAGCGPPNTVIQISVVNDQPSTTATLTVTFCGQGLTHWGAYSNFGIQIGTDGKGTTSVNTYDTCPVGVGFVCGSGAVPTIPNPSLRPNSDSKRTINCQYTQPIPATAGWPSFSDSMDAVHLDKNPQIVSPIESSSLDPSDEGNRESVARGFLGESETISCQAHVLYDWLLATGPPDSTVENNLLAGQSSESQIAYIAAGSQFYSAGGGTNSGFVTRLYSKLLDRNPTSWELQDAVTDLNGYWVENECEPECYWYDGLYVCDPRPPQCGYSWYQKSRNEFAWEILSSHEFHQVAARYMYGIQLRRSADSSEIESQAFHIGAYGLKEGAVRLLKTSEYMTKSRDPW